MPLQVKDNTKSVQKNGQMKGSDKMPKSKFAEMAKTDEQRATEFQHSIAINIMMLMLEKDLNQMDMARLTKIAQPNISSKLNGNIAITLQDIVKFAKALKVSPSDLTKEKAPDRWHSREQIQIYVVLIIA